MHRNVIEVDILPQDFAKSPLGYSNGLGPEEGCVLYQALKRIYPNKYVFVSADLLNVDKQIFKIPTRQWGKDSFEFSIGIINELSRQAKKSLEGIPTVSLTLEPI